MIRRMFSIAAIVAVCLASGSYSFAQNGLDGVDQLPLDPVPKPMPDGQQPAPAPIPEQPRQICKTATICIDAPSPAPAAPGCCCQSGAGAAASAAAKASATATTEVQWVERRRYQILVPASQVAALQAGSLKISSFASQGSLPTGITVYRVAPAASNAQALATAQVSAATATTAQSLTVTPLVIQPSVSLAAPAALASSYSFAPSSNGTVAFSNSLGSSTGEPTIQNYTLYWRGATGPSVTTFPYAVQANGYIPANQGTFPPAPAPVIPGIQSYSLGSGIQSFSFGAGVQSFGYPAATPVIYGAPVGPVYYYQP